MVRKNRLLVVSALVLGVGFLATAALADTTPVINSAVINLRVFNDFPNSTTSFGNNYPTSLFIRDANFQPNGWTNRHNFRLSENGFTAAVFNNDAKFSFFSDVTLSGTTENIEGGLNFSPWWSQNVDGVFHVRAPDGEIAAFGGRLPFYSFTGSQGLTYTKGTTVGMGISYDPHSLSPSDPATIEYTLIQGANTYTSGPLAYNEGNPAEGYGSWGNLNDGRVGGFMQTPNSWPGPGDVWGRIDFAGMVFIPEPASLLLGLLGLVLRRR
jgi:hypothetical protein